MPSLLPSPADDYAAPQDMRLNKAAWDAALVSVGSRLRSLEAVKASFEALIALGTGQALEVIQANVAPQLEALRQALASLEAEIAAAQDQIHDIIVGSVPASAVTETANRLWLTPALKARIEASAALASPALTGTPTAPTAPAGTATGQLATTAHVAQSLAALGGSGNRLPNANGAAGLAGVSIMGPSNITFGVAGVLGQHSVWLPPGVGGWFLIQPDEAAVYSWFDFHDGAGNPFPVQAGELYQCSIYTGNHRAVQLYLDLVWYDAAGTVIGTSNSIGGTNAAGATVIAFSGANGGASPEAPSGPRFEDARRLWVISTAPPGAARVTPRLVKGPTKAGLGTSAMFAYRPYFGEAAPGQVLPSAWSHGPATAEIRAAVDALVDAAPGALDTLNELAAALGDDANFSASVATALAARVRVDAAQALNETQKAQGRSNLGAQAALGYTPANKAGDTFAGNVTIGTAVYQTDGNVLMPWAGGLYLHQLLPYFADNWFPDNHGAPRLSYQSGGTTSIRGAGGTDRTAFAVQRSGDGVPLFQVEGSGDLYVAYYGAYLSTVLTRAKNIRLGGRSFWDIRIDAGPWDHIAVFGEVMVGLHSYPATDGSRNIAGFYYAALQQQDIWGNWYGIAAS